MGEELERICLLRLEMRMLSWYEPPPRTDDIASREHVGRQDEAERRDAGLRKLAKEAVFAESRGVRIGQDFFAQVGWEFVEQRPPLMMLPHLNGIEETRCEEIVDPDRHVTRNTVRTAVVVDRITSPSQLRRTFGKVMQYPNELGRYERAEQEAEALNDKNK